MEYVQDKAIPLQALTGPEGTRWLKLPDLKKVGTLTLCRQVANLIKYPLVPGLFKFFERSTPKCTVTYILTL
jgi:hypothetical protein